MVVKHHLSTRNWVLGPSARAVNFYNCWAISPVLQSSSMCRKKWWYRQLAIYSLTLIWIRGEKIFLEFLGSNFVEYKRVKCLLLLIKDSVSVLSNSQSFCIQGIHLATWNYSLSFFLYTFWNLAHDNSRSVWNCWMTRAMVKSVWTIEQM